MAWGFGLLSSCIPCREGLGDCMYHKIGVDDFPRLD
jgi:hypothetical protein